jgi:hypothetical protein
LVGSAVVDKKKERKKKIKKFKNCSSMWPKITLIEGFPRAH